MIPSEILAVIRDVSIAYLPVGSMEWHGPHMGMGMDTINAYAVALGTAERLGGAVIPPLYIGTEGPRSPETLRKIGFAGDEHIVGMDFPKNSLSSMYWPEELFRLVIRQQAKFLCDMGFRTVAIINGHGADNQMMVLRKVAEELSAETDSRVVSFFIVSTEGLKVGRGHAGQVETSIMLALNPDGIDLGMLPKKPEKLRNVDYAIVDSETFRQGGNEDFTVEFDPRDATAALGRDIVECEIKRCAEMLANIIREMP